MLNKRENKEVLEYIRTEVPKIINTNPSFVSIFGNKMAENNLRNNVIRVYTNEISKMYLGYFENRSITICASGKFGKKLKVKDIINNKTLMEAVVHECIHAILYRRDSKSTGILQKYNNKEDGENEAGRGLNEGYTVWLCKKLGFAGNHYRSLTKIVGQIECARGTERTMDLGRGIENINFYANLGLGMKNGKKLIIDTDTIYWLNFQIEYLNEMKGEIVEGKTIGQIKKRLSKYEIYELDEYIEELEENSTKEDMLQYISDSIKERKAKRDLFIWKTEKMIFEEFFLEDFRIMMKSTFVSQELLKKMSKYQALLNSLKIDIPEEEKESEFAKFIAIPLITNKKMNRVYEQRTKSTANTRNLGKSRAYSTNNIERENIEEVDRGK